MDRAHRKRKPVGICGQAPSNYLDFAEFLVEQGIDSISLSPDAIVDTINVVYKKEQKLKKSNKSIK